MPLIVENGIGLEKADSYVDVEFCDVYHEQMGNSGWMATAENEAAREIALRRGTAFIDLKYGSRATGRKKNSKQALVFPRAGSDEVPTAVKKAACEAALRAFTGVDMMPDLARGGQIISETIGPISTTYAAGAPTSTRFEVLDALMAAFIHPPIVSAVRG